MVQCWDYCGPGEHLHTQGVCWKYLGGGSCGWGSSEEVTETNCLVGRSRAVQAAEPRIKHSLLKTADTFYSSVSLI